MTEVYKFIIVVIGLGLKFIFYTKNSLFLVIIIYTAPKNPKVRNR